MKINYQAIRQAFFTGHFVTAEWRKCSLQLSTIYNSTPPSDISLHSCLANLNDASVTHLSYSHCARTSKVHLNNGLLSSVDMETNWEYYLTFWEEFWYRECFLNHLNKYFMQWYSSFQLLLYNSVYNILSCELSLT